MYKVEFDKKLEEYTIVSTVIGDKMFMSNVAELRQPALEKQSKAWLTLVPPSLTILR